MHLNKNIMLLYKNMMLNTMPNSAKCKSIAFTSIPVLFSVSLIGCIVIADESLELVFFSVCSQFHHLIMHSLPQFKNKKAKLKLTQSKHATSIRWNRIKIKRIELPVKAMKARHQLHKWQAIILLIFWDQRIQTQWTISIRVIHMSEPLHSFLHM